MLSTITENIQAQAISPEKIKAECVRQMRSGICISRPDRLMASTGKTILLSGAGRVPYAAYAEYAKLFNISNQNDTKMCDLALFYMKNNPGGDHDRIARAMWTPIEIGRTK